MSESSDDRNPVEELAEEFLARHRRGEMPSQKEYLERHPELADDIRELFPTLLMMEEIKPDSDDLTSTLDSNKPRQEKHVPERIGDFRILREIGHGGMGVVYEAEQLSLGRSVALKLLPDSMGGNETALRRFHREARAAAQLHHTNIVPVFEVGGDGARCFYAMQFIMGHSLDDVIAEISRLRLQSNEDVDDGEESIRQLSRPAESLWQGEFHPPDLTVTASSSGSQAAESEPTCEAASLADHVDTEANSHNRTTPGRLSDASSLSGVETKRHHYHLGVARMGIQIAGALDYAHGRKILHRDIKPSNLLLDNAGVVWITDFGLAKIDDDNLTRTGDLVGTLRYMAPERFRGICDARSDVYSLGISLYEMLALRAAFEETDRLQLIRAIVQEQPPSLRFRDRRIPRDLETIVLKAIEKDPKRRYQTARQLGDDLRRFVDDEPIRARRVSIGERALRWARHNKRLAASLVAVFLLLVTLTVSARHSANDLAIYANNLKKRVEGEQAARSQVEQQRDSLKRLQDQLTERLYGTEMILASQLVGNPSRTDQIERILARWIPKSGERDLRDWDWFWLLGQANQAERTLRGHTASVRCVAWSPDGRLWASGSDDRTIAIWDANTRMKVRSLRADEGAINCVAFSPDSTRLATATSQGEIRVWDLQAARVILSLRCSNGDYVGDVAWSTDGTRLAWVGLGGLLNITDVDTGSNLQICDTDEMAIAMDWHSESNRIAVGGGSGRIRVFDSTTGARILDIVGHQGILWELAWSPDGKRLASASSDSSVRVWYTETGEELPGPGEYWWGGKTCVAWSSDGSRLASCGNDRSIMIWDAGTGRQEQLFTGHLNAVMAVFWSPNGRYVLSGSNDWTVRLWEADATQSFDVKPEDGSDIQHVAWNGQATQLALARADNSMEVWDTRRRQVVARIPELDRQVRGCCFDAASNELAFVDADVLHVWRYGEDAVRKRLARPPSCGEFTVIAPAPQGGQCATGHEDGRVHVWNTKTEAMITVLNGSSEEKVVALEWAPDGKRLVAADANHRIYVWQMDDGRLILDKPSGLDWINGFAWSPDGDRFAAAGGMPRIWAGLGISSQRGLVKIWDLRRPGRVIRLEGHDGYVSSVAWSPDGKRVLTAAADCSAKVWAVSPNSDSDNQRELVSMQEGNPVLSATWSDDGFRIVSLNGNGVVQTHDATRGHRSVLSQRLWNAKSADTSLNESDEVAQLAFKASLYARQGQWNEAAEAFKKIDIRCGVEAGLHITPWWVAGPYSAKLEESQGPETKGFPLPSATSATGELWRLANVDSTGLVDFNMFFSPGEQKSGYARTRIYSTREKEVGIILGSSDMVRLWINGAMVHEYTRERTANPNDDVVMTRLGEGWNDLVAKVVTRGADHLLLLRLSTDPAELAAAHEQGERWPEAEASWTRAIELDPDSGFLWLQRSLVRSRLNLDNEADADFMRASNLMCSPAEPFVAAADNLERMGRIDEAIAQLDEACRLDPQQQYIRCKIAQIRINHGEFVEAERDLTLANALVPDDHWTVYWLLTLRLLLGDEEGFFELRAEALKRWKDCTNPNTAERISKACMMFPIEGKEREVAVAMARRALEADQEHLTYAFLLNAEGIACYRSGQYEEAIDVLSRSMELPQGKGNNALGTLNRLFLAMAYVRVGRSEDAAKPYSNARIELLKRFPRLDVRGFEEIQRAWHDWSFCLFVEKESRTLVELAIEESLRNAVAKRQEKDGLQDSETLSLMVSLGRYYRAWGRIEAAEEVLKRVLEIQQASEFDQSQRRATARELSLLYGQQVDLDSVDGEWLRGANRSIVAYEIAGLDEIWKAYNGLRAAAMLGKAGNPRAYQDLCRTMIQDLAAAGNPEVRRVALKSCLILPAQDTDTREKVRLLVKRESASPPNSPEVQLLRGIAEYRAGNLDQAFVWLSNAIQAENLRIRGHAAAFLAMTLWRRGEHEDAETDLKQSQELLREQLSTLSIQSRCQHDMLLWQLFLEEARSVCRQPTDQSAPTEIVRRRGPPESSQHRVLAGS